MMSAVRCNCMPIINKSYIQIISLTKTRVPGVLANATATVMYVVCIGHTKAWSTIPHAWVILGGRLLHINIYIMVATGWCIRLWVLVIRWPVFDTEYLNNHWNASTKNSPPFPCIQRTWHGYLASHVCMLLCICNKVVSPIWTNSTRFEAVSMHVNALS